MKSIFILIATAIMFAVQNPKDIQNKTITGTVIYEDDGSTLPGVTVTVKGSTVGTITDIDGKYTLTIVPDDAKTLVFTFVGMETQEIEINGQTVVNASLKSADVGLDEVVVTAMGVKRSEKKLGYSATTISSDELSSNKSKKSLNSLEGKVAGVDISSASGSPGASTRVIFRGYSSIPDDSGVKIKAVKNDETSVNTTIETVEEKNKVSENTEDENSLSFFTSNPTELKVKNKLELNKEYLGSEKYDKITENVFVNPFFEPLSTFSVDVDKASYSNCRRFIEAGQLPPKDAVRIEEFINYFSYNYAEPMDTFPFSVNIETSDCPWNEKNQVVSIGLQGKSIGVEKLPASNLVFLIDVSGSMSSYNKLPLLKASLEILVNNMRPIDKIAIVTYAGTAGVKLQSTFCTDENKEKIMAAITGLYAGGSTAGAAGITMAYNIAVENFIENGNNRVVLSTDGDFNVGTSSTTDLVTMIEEKRESGVYLSLMGFGMGNLNDEMMEKLSNAGNGNYAYIDDIEEAKKVFDEEFSSTIFTIAKDVKIQIEFNPAKVKAYRLIGYENRMLESEDFDNDAIDAGEIGAGHTVTAMYEIVPAEEGENTLLASLDEFQSIVIDKEELMTVKLRYKNPDEDQSNLIKYSFKNSDLVSEQSSDNMKFISAVVEFGMILRNSAFKSESDFDSVIALAEEATKNSTDTYKLEFIELVKKAKELDK